MPPYCHLELCHLGTCMESRNECGRVVMPASSAEVIGAALQSAYRHPHLPPLEGLPPPSTHLEDQLSVCSKQVLLSPVEYERVGPQQTLVLDSLKTKYVTITTTTNNNNNTSCSSSSSSCSSSSSSTPVTTSPPGSMAQAPPSRPSSGDQLEEPQVVLWSRDKVTLGWRKTFPPGAGMVNLGNTCYLNSSLQALFHIPALANWLLEELQSHTQRCETNTANASFCSVCAMMRTFRATLDRSTPVIKPSLIQHKLKSIGKTLMYGRQEDAHEFIKLLLDHMEKSYLTFRRATKLDHRSKETTPLNQIFGGYIRQQVICPLCRYVSTTFSHFQDLVLDIRSVSSVDDALNLHFKKETLDVDNAYKCERCHKKVPATKRHLIERAPHVLLIQLKRFTMNGGKIGKHINIQRTIDISRFVSGGAKQGGTSGPYQYRLASMVIHLGGSQHGGHYTAVAEASSGTMFEYDDSSVRSISVQSALLRNPYILFYEMIRKPKEVPHVKQVLRQSSEKALIRQNSDGVTKPLPTSHSASSVTTNGYPHSSPESGGDTGRGVHAPSPKPPLPSHKERDRISFGLKGMPSKGDTNKPNKIILNSGTTSLLGTKSSSSPAKPSLQASCSSKPSVSLSSSTSSKSSVISSGSSKSSNPSSSNPVKSSVSSSLTSKSHNPSGISSKSSGNPSSFSSKLQNSSSRSSTPSKLHVNPSSAKASNPSSSNPSKSSFNPPSLVPYPDDSDSELDDTRRVSAKGKALQNGKIKGEEKGARVKSSEEKEKGGKVKGDDERSAKVKSDDEKSARIKSDDCRVKGDTEKDARVKSDDEKSAKAKTDEQKGARAKSDDQKGSKMNSIKGIKCERMNGHLQRPDRLTNGEAENSRGKGVAPGTLVPRSLQVSGSNGTRGKGDSGWQVTDASLHSPSEGSGGSGSQLSFTVVEQPISTSRLDPDKSDKPESQGWTVTVQRRTRPELEKSHSHDCVLPGSSQQRMERTDEPDSASLKSKASVDSGRSDRSTKSMKKSLFSLFTCVSSARSPDSPEEVQPEAQSHRETPVTNGVADGNAYFDQSQSKRLRDHEESEPASPSKKSCPEDQSQDTTTSVTTTTTTTVTTTITTTATVTTTTATLSKNGPALQSDNKSKNWPSDVEVPKNGAVLHKSKNGHSERGSKGSSADLGIHYNGTKKDSSSSTSTSSLSSTSSDSESSGGEGDEGQWVEKTKETIGMAKVNSSPHVVQWNNTVRDLSNGDSGRDCGKAQSQECAKRTGLWDGTRSSEVVDQLRRAGSLPYGTKVNTWGGGRSQLDLEGEKARKEAKKRSSLDMYNEELDSGRTKKAKVPKKSSWSSPQPQSSYSNNNNSGTTTNNNNRGVQGNPFQRVQDFRNSCSPWMPHQRQNNGNNNNNMNYRFNNSNNKNNNTPSYYNPLHPPGPPRYTYWNKGNRNGGGPQNRPWGRHKKFHSKKYKDKYKYGW